MAALRQSDDRPSLVIRPPPRQSDDHPSPVRRPPPSSVRRPTLASQKTVPRHSDDRPSPKGHTLLVRWPSLASGGQPLTRQSPHSTHFTATTNPRAALFQLSDVRPLADGHPLVVRLPPLTRQTPPTIQLPFSNQMAALQQTAAP